MRTETATNAKNHFGAIMDAALREPVLIQRSGRNSVVMIPYDDYEAFEALSDKIWVERAIEAEKEGYLGAEESEAIIQRLLNADT
jgi:prevent-host-death family protein